jgi:hypothetical protein
LPDTDGIVLLDELRDLRTNAGRYEAAVITTFNASLPFFEELVLRRLEVGGCGHVVLGMDAGQLAASLERSEERPARAGRDYTLAALSAPGGSFHPKLLLLVGPKGGKLFVGSHNATYSGLSDNREVTTAIEVDGPKDRAGARLLHEALAFVLAWAPVREGEALRAVRRFAPWIDGPAPAAAADTFVGSTPGGPSLWTRVLEHLPRPCRRVLLVGPFFDHEVAFLRQLQRSAPDAEILIGIEPSTVVLDDRAARALRGFRFVDASQLGYAEGEHPGYLHAKVIVFESGSECVLVAGSANPSAAAWLAGPGHRNAEAVVVRTGAGATAAVKALGLASLRDAPAVSSASWSAIAERFAAKRSEKRDTVAKPVLHFVESTMGLEAETSTQVDERGAEARVWCPDAVNAFPAPLAVDGSRVSIRIADDAQKSSASLVRLEAGSRTLAWGIVHHPTELAERATPGSQRQLRQALGALEDGTQLESLLKMVNKVIFEAPIEVTTVRAGEPAKAQAAKASGWDDHELGVPLAATARNARRRYRAIASGDIAVLLDALNRRLAEGLVPTGKLESSRTDEAIVGTEDDRLVELPESAPDREALAALCRRKTGTLLRRMVRHVELARNDDDAIVERTLVQLAAVLGVVRSIRRIQNQAQWRGLREPLVDEDALSELFWAACEALAGPAGLLARAGPQASSVLEISEALEHLGWVAWELEVEFGPFSRNAVSDDGDDDDHDPENLARWFADLALLAEVLAGDRGALERLEQTLGLTPVRGRDPSTFTARLAVLGETLRTARAGGSVPRLTRPIAPGDVVLIGKSRELATVIAVRGPHVDVVNEKTGDEERTFLATALVGLDWSRHDTKLRAG